MEEAGSGVIIEQKRPLLRTDESARDPRRRAAAIKINLADGRRIYPTKVLQDVESDVAVLALSAPDLVAASIGDSNRIDIGDFVLAVGSPFGLSHSVTYGIISAKGRRDLHLAARRSPSRISCRPTPPSIPATAAARWSTFAAR